MIKFPKEWLRQKELEDSAGQLAGSDFSFSEMLHTYDFNCVGYIAKNGLPVLYGKHYASLLNAGKIMPQNRARPAPQNTPFSHMPPNSSSPDGRDSNA